MTNFLQLHLRWRGTPKRSASPPASPGGKGTTKNVY